MAETEEKKESVKTTMYPEAKLKEEMKIVANLENTTQTDILNRFLKQGINNYEKKDKVEQIYKMKRE